MKAAAVRFEGWQPRGTPLPVSPAQRAAIIRSSTRVRRPLFVAELALYRADEPFTIWQRTEEAVGGAALPPPYWAFAWAGGLALARYLLDQPEAVAGRAVLDVGAGSGLVAIAAARAGAKRVVANEIDLFARVAIALNAELNGVVVDVDGRDLLDSEPEGFDVVIAADLFYERETSERTLRFLERVAANGARVLIGDLGRRYLPRERLTAVAAYDLPVEAALEDAPIKRTTVWRLRDEQRGAIRYT